MAEVFNAIVEWLQASMKQSPYVWCAAGLTFLIGAQLALAVSIAHGDEETVRRQLNNLQKVDTSRNNNSLEKGSEKVIAQETESKDEEHKISPVTSCAPIKINLTEHPNAQDKYDNCYGFAVESGKADSQGFAVWTSLNQENKPALSKITTELWLPKPNADENDPLVQSEGCIIMSFPDPVTPTWLAYFAGYTGDRFRMPQVACILPIRPTADEIKEHKIKMRPFRIDGEDGKGLDMEGLPAVSDILARLKVFLNHPERQGITIFKRA
ncbi:hypothetical protein ACHAPQ_011969 [Fusarium lateritium]